MRDIAGWNPNDLRLFASVKDEVSQWRASFASYLVPYEARVQLANGEEKWSTIGDYDINIVWTRHQDGSITYEVMHTPGWNLDNDEQYCNVCHSEMYEDESGNWHCSHCGNIYSFDDINTGVINCPSEEASYDWENIACDPVWYEND